MAVEGFAAMFRTATGNEPYAWQQRLAAEGLPTTLEVPTGCGKTAGLLVSWLWRRRFHPDAAVRAGTPRKLIFTLPMRTLVSQTAEVAERCVTALELAGEVELVTLMGGEPASDAWRLRPERDAVVVCTLDMALSGALNRAYGSSRFTWPVTFGMLNNDTHWVFDEVQLFGPAAATSRQLQAFRDAIGTNLVTSSTWMSATLDLDALRTVDAPEVPVPFCIDRSAEPQELIDRLDAPRRFVPWLPDRPEKADAVSLARDRARRLLAEHRPGTRTLAVLNTVDAARGLHAAVLKEVDGAEVTLLHSRFRPCDRADAMRRVLEAPGESGSIVVSTQVIEAGVDISSAALFTEVAPWSSIVQRAGRCNRYAEIPASASADEVPRVFWDPPRSDGPYDGRAIEAAAEALSRLGEVPIGTAGLGQVSVEQVVPDAPLVLRRTDLLRLFDTAPDLSGNDLDIAPYLRDGDDIDAYLCWRVLDDQLQPVDAAPPSRDELCPVPVRELREWLKTHPRVLRLDHLDHDEVPRGRPKHQWVRATSQSVRPGQIYVASVDQGGYRPDLGWDPKLTGDVESVAPAEPGRALAPADETLGEDPASTARGRWVSLSQHLGDVHAEVTAIIDEVAPGLDPVLAASTRAAGRWHDLGKAHAVFQDTMQRTRGPSDPDPGPGPWAKSAGRARARHERPYFRHELASALALLGDAGNVLPSDLDRELTIYLVAAHHGRVRMSIRSFPGEAGAVGDQFVLGISPDDVLVGGEFDGVIVPDARPDLGVTELGHPGGSWVDLATRLRDRADLGVFRLGHLEALVRVADWRTSAGYDEEHSE